MSKKILSEEELERRAERIKQRSKDYYRENKERMLAAGKKWKERNIDKYRSYQSKYRKNRRAVDEEFKERTNRHSTVFSHKSKLNADDKGDQNGNDQEKEA